MLIILLSRPDFLRKETWRKTLKITRYAIVEKVIFDSAHKAKGVVYWRANKRIEVRATKEVILSAGVFGTPKILILSGLGPQSHLRDLGVSLPQR
jgi:choline dehydrogenase